MFTTTEDKRIFSNYHVLGCYSDKDMAWKQANSLKEKYPNWYVSVHSGEDGYQYVIVKK